MANSHILHWTGRYKPWMCEGPYSEIWQRYNRNHKLPFAIPKTEPELSICSSQTITRLPDAKYENEQYTMVITSFARNDTLHQIVKHVLTSNYLKEVVIVWNNLDIPCPRELVKLDRVRCLQQSKNLVHNR